MMSSLYIGATGLKSHGEGMGVITNNLANVNTVGFKQMSMQYSDLMSEFLTTSAGNLTNFSQKGMGATPGSVRTLFEQGGLETGSEATDLCISGTGFFGVARNGQTEYTRAGNFRFNNAGELLDPSGWNLLGRPIVNGVEGTAAEPVVLDTSDAGVGYMPPKASSVLSSSSQLGGLRDSLPSPDNPFFSMASSWDGTSALPLIPGRYSYSEPVEFYDAKGDLRSATVYYDLAGNSGGMTAVEYLLAMDPGQDASARAGTQAGGLLLAGTLSFASNGEMTRMTAFTPPNANPAELENWTPAAVKDGKPVFSVQSSGLDAQEIALDMGFLFGPNSSVSANLSSAAEAAQNPGAVFSPDTGGSAGKNASNFLGAQPSALYSSRDGYAPGHLRELEVSREGLVRGVYTNSQNQDLYRISLYRFTSQDGLRHEGNNHYAATPDSGSAEEGKAGTENFGSFSSHSLEQSNVDYAREFSLLIVTQRGFQMNSKVITTSDTMLQRALELKR